MKLEMKFKLDFPPDSLVKAMADPDLIREDQESRHALSVDFEDLEKSKTRHKFRVLSKQYTHGLKGIDKTKTEMHETIIDWDLKARQSTWTWTSDSEMSKRAHVSGATKVVAAGAGAEITLSVDVDIDVPMVGGVIAKKVIAGFEKGWPPYIEIVKRWAAKY